jgi:hypothetical protein
MSINCKGINASGIHIPKSGIKYVQVVMVSLIRLKVTYIYLLRKNSIHLEKVTRPFVAMWI